MTEFICTCLFVFFGSIIWIFKRLQQALMEDEILFRNGQAHQTEYDIALVRTEEMRVWRNLYVRNYPDDNSSPREQDQDRDQDMDLEEERLEAWKNDVNDPDRRALMYYHSNSDDAGEVAE